MSRFKLKNFLLFSFEFDLVSIVHLYRFLFNCIKVSLCLTLALSSLSSANPALFNLYKNNEFKIIADNYGPRYLKLNFSELIVLSEAYKSLKDYDKQIKILNILNTKKPDYHKIHLALAEANKNKVYSYIKANKEYESYEAALANAVEFFRSAIKLDPNDYSAYKGLMDIFKDQENVPEGMALTKQMLAKFGEQPEIVLNLCEWTNKYGLVAQTKKACSKAAILLPENPTPQINIAMIMKDSGKDENYKSKTMAIYKKFPNDEKVVDLMGELFIESKDYFNAEKTLLKNKNSKLESSRINLATALYENEKFDQALDYFRESCELVNDQRKKFLRYFESRLRRLEMNGQEEMSYKFQKELNLCRSKPVTQADDRKVTSSDFSQGIRLPANARNIEGKTLEDKRFNYEQNRLQGKSKSVKPLKTNNTNK